MRPAIYLVDAPCHVAEVIEIAARQLECIVLPHESMESFSSHYDESAAGCVVLCVNSNENLVIAQLEKFQMKYPKAQLVLCVSNWSVSNIVLAVKRFASDVLGPEMDLTLANAALNLALNRDRFHRSRSQFDLPSSIVDQLSPEEAMIFGLMLQGRTTKQVGAELDLSVRTIHYRKKSIFQKMGGP